MPVLQTGAERCALPAGTYTLGGRSPNALPLPSLERLPEVATIVVPRSGDTLIQRTTAAVVVRLNQTPIGIAPKPLSDGTEIEFNGCRLIFTADRAGEVMLSWASDHEADDADPLLDAPRAVAAPVATQIDQARLVNVRTADVIDLGDDRVVIGRDETCDVMLPAMNVSRRHCSITPVQGGYFLRDESANGTLVNGSRVSGTYLLGHGDIVRVGDEELRFEVAGSPPAAASTTAAPTLVLDVSRHRSEHAREQSNQALSALTANLEIVRGPFSGASFLIDRAVCSIGRAGTSDVRIRDDSVSAHHATLLRKGTSWFVVDLRSANGTFVDGLRIAGEREITSGSRLKLGRVELMFRALEGGVEATTARRRRRILDAVIEFFGSRRRSAD